MKSPYINTSQNFYITSGRNGIQTSLKVKQEEKKKIKACQTWLGRGSKAVIRDPFLYPSCTFNYVASFSARPSTCGSKMVLEERRRDNISAPPTPTPCLLCSEKFQWNGTSLLLKKQDCMLASSFRIITELEREYSTWQTRRRKGRYSVWKIYVKLRFLSLEKKKELSFYQVMEEQKTTGLGIYKISWGSESPDL